MILQRTLSAFFQDIDGEKITGLSPTVTVYNTTNGARTTIGTYTMLEMAPGIYAYTYATFDTEKEYVFMFDGGASLDSMTRYKFAGTDGNIPVEDQLSAIQTTLAEMAESIITIPM